VERCLGIYDYSTEKRLHEIPLVATKEQLRHIMVPPEEDEVFYDSYVLDQEQLKKFNDLFYQTVKFESGKYYVLECWGIYDRE
jgi:hypothetical protein